MKKNLWVTVDYYDDALRAGRLYSREDLDAMMAYAASLGAARLQWIVDTAWTLYHADSPQGFDLLAVACEAAHRHGLRFDAIFKPFEGVLGGSYGLLPEGLPVSADAPLLSTPNGLLHAFRPEVARYPDASLSRADDDAVDPGGRIEAIRLVKNDAAPAPFGPGDLSLWTSARNGDYARYDGPVEISERLEWRFQFPYPDQPCRIVTLGGLRFPDDTRFVRIRREQPGAAFVNAVEQIVEMVNPRGEPIPCTPALRPMKAEAIYKHLSRCVALGLTRFARLPEARALLADREAFLARCEGMCRFDAGWENASLGEGDALVAARGKLRTRTGAMHPIYPEVRAAWLDQVRFCIDRGVDGVNFRAANHNQVYEPRFFGFNPPVLERMTHPGNFAEAERINGAAYTDFLREAAALLHDAGREIGVHVHGLMLRHADRAPNISMVPLNFEWQWETWFKEFADYAEYRGAFFFRPENQRYVADRIGFAARAAGIPLAYQSLRGVMMHYDGPHHALAHEMDWVRKHPDIAAYNLYEMANLSRCQPETGFEGSRDIAELVRQHWPAKGENL